MAAAKKSTIYAYIKPQNKRFLQRLGLKTNNSVSDTLDTALDALRLKKEFDLPVKPNKGLEKIKRSQERKRQRIATA